MPYKPLEATTIRRDCHGGNAFSYKMRLINSQPNINENTIFMP